MCGIWAIFGSDRDVARYHHNANKIARRGPDFFRVQSVRGVANCCLAFHRLAIMDDLFGEQPMRVRCHPHIWLLYNGEIYNYRTVQKQFGFEYLTNCDGEAIIHLYAQGGAEYAASMLDGVFAFCLLDTAAKKVVLGRDTYGVKPLFTLLRDDGFLGICSEAKGLIELENTEGDDPSVIAPFPPGHVESYQLAPSGKVTAQKGRIAFHSIERKPKWSDIPSTVQPNHEEDISANIRALFTDAVRKRLMSQRKVGALLSGGLDSSLVAALMVKLARESGIQYPLQTYTIGMEGSPDVAAARKVAEYIGSEHHEIAFTPEECYAVLDEVIYFLESYETITIRPSTAMYLMSRYIREKTDRVVIFSGEGSDELAQGYLYFHQQPSAKEGDADSRRLLRDLYLYDVLRADRMTAAHGLELRLPFLDHHFTSYYLSLPAELRRPQRGVEKYLLRKAFHGTGLLPPEILWRQKEGFSDGLCGEQKSLFEFMAEFVDSKVDGSLLEKAKDLYPQNTPRTKESLYYRQVFEGFYPGHGAWTPYAWLPRWCGNLDEPSARLLAHYHAERPLGPADPETGGEAEAEATAAEEMPDGVGRETTRVDS